LVALFRAGHDEAFRVIHDRYRQRLFAYTRQMLPGRQDAEDALQDVFVRAYSGLRAGRGQLILRAWLYRIAHNRCIDELRRPAPPPPELLQLVRPPIHDPIAAADQRESLRRLVADVRRLPEQQRSALLMRELGGMAYADMACALGVSVPAVKSLLVRARIALAQALEARDTACSEIRSQLTLAHDRGVRASGTARRHMHDCKHCRHFHRELRGVSRSFAALTPSLGPLGVVAKVLGLGGGGGAAAGGSAAAAGGVAGTGGAIASLGLFAGGAGHVATLIAAAVVTAGGAVELQSSITANPAAHHHHARLVATAPAAAPSSSQSSVASVIYAATPAAAPATIIPARSTAVQKSRSHSKTTTHPGKVPAAGNVHLLSQSPATLTGPITGGASDPSADPATSLDNGVPIDTTDPAASSTDPTSGTGSDPTDPSTATGQPPASTSASGTTGLTSVTSPGSTATGSSGVSSGSPGTTSGSAAPAATTPPVGSGS
jgi:RNA polymerase sigma factor (sigma-70 family)